MEHVSEIVKSSLTRSNRKRKVFCRKQRPILPASALPMKPKPVAINPLNKINLPVKKLLEIRRNMSIPVLLREPNVGTESAAWETTLSDTAKVISHKTNEAKAKEKLAPAVQLVKETFPVGPPKQSTRRKGKKPVKYSSVVSSVSDSDSGDDSSGNVSLINCLNIKQEKLESNISDPSLQEISVRFPDQELAPAQQIQVPGFVSVSKHARPQRPSVAPTVIGTNMSPIACILQAPLLHTPNVGRTPVLSTAALKNPIGALQPVCVTNNQQYMLVPIYGGGGNNPLDLSRGNPSSSQAASSFAQKLRISNENSLGQGPRSISATGTTIEILGAGKRGKKSQRKGAKPSKLKIKACRDAIGNTLVSEQSDVSVNKSAQQEVKVSKRSPDTTVGSVRLLSGVGQAHERRNQKTKVIKTRLDDDLLSETSVSQGSLKIQVPPMPSCKAVSKRTKKRLDSREEVAKILSVVDSNRSSLKAHSSGTEINDNDVSSNLNPVDNGFRTKKYKFCFETNGLTVMTNDRHLIRDDCGNASARVQNSEITEVLNHTQWSADSDIQWRREVADTLSGDEHRLNSKPSKCDLKNSRKEGTKDLGYSRTISGGVVDPRLSPLNRGEVAEILSQIDTVHGMKEYRPRSKMCPEKTPQFTSLTVKNEISSSSKSASIVLNTDEQAFKSDPTTSHSGNVDPYQASLAGVKRESEDQADRHLIRIILGKVPILDRLGPSGANRNSGEIVRTPSRDMAGNVTYSSNDKYRAWKPSETMSGHFAGGFEPATVSETSCDDDPFSNKDTHPSRKSEVRSIRIKEEPVDPDDTDTSEGKVSERLTVHDSNSKEWDGIPNSSESSKAPVITTKNPNSRKDVLKSHAASALRKTLLPVPGIEIKKEPVDSHEEPMPDRNVFKLFSAEKQSGYAMVESSKSSSKSKFCFTDLSKLKSFCLPERLKTPVLAEHVKSEVIEDVDGQGRSNQGSACSLTTVSVPKQGSSVEKVGETEVNLECVIKTEPLEDSTQFSGITIEPVSSECDTKLNRMLFDFAASISANFQIPGIKQEQLEPDSPTVDDTADRMVDKSFIEVQSSECAEKPTPHKRTRRKRKCSVVVADRNTRRKGTRRTMVKSDEAGYKCYCGQSFLCIAKLVIHRRVHTGEKPWKCPTCEKCFARRDVMKRHCNIHVNDRRFCCDQCPKRFLYLYELNRHRRTHTGEKRFECHLCGKRLTQMTGLKRHLDTHKGDKPYSCNICKKKFCRKSVLVKHMGRRHENILVLCPICAMGFRSKSAQIGHLASHSGTKRNQCVVCKAQFSGLYSLQRHMSVHSISVKGRRR